MSDSTVYLTFDDGPLGGTDDVIATLNEMKVRGTLFMVGNCQVPCNYIPKRSNPLLQAREVLRLLAEEGIEGSGKEAKPRGDGD